MAYCLPNLETSVWIMLYFIVENIAKPYHFKQSNALPYWIAYLSKYSGCAYFWNIIQDAYIASAQQYAQVTDLSKRVQQWEDKIRPILKREVSKEIWTTWGWFNCLKNEDINRRSSDIILQHFAWFSKLTIHHPVLTSSYNFFNNLHKTGICECNSIVNIQLL